MWRSIRFKFVVVYLLLLLFSLELIGAYFVRTLTSSLINNQTQTVQNQAQLMATLTAPQISTTTRSTDQVTSVLSSFPQFLNGTVYILSRDGSVLDTSVGGALIGQKRTDSVATQSLISHKTTVSIRFDPISSQHLLAVAVPMFNHAQFVGLVEYVVPIQDTYNTVKQVTTIFYTGSAVVLLFTVLLGIILSRAITRPVLDVTKQARTMASGDFTKRVEVRSDDEFGDLATAINDLTGKLEDAIDTSTREQERLQAVITSMGDAVIALDADLNPMFMNQAARQLLPQSGDQRNQVGTLLGLELTPTARQDGAVNQVFVREIGDTMLHIHLTALQRGQSLDGYVAVLRDVTEQEKLNRARRDFVANVSHELRTPLTSIKSYIEAVQELEMQDVETRNEFLDVIAKETDRMVRLTRDLLQLSGLDAHPATTNTYRRLHVSTWLHAAFQRFQLQARNQGIEMEIGQSVDCLISGSKDMLDRVLDNLLSNALKYTQAGGHIIITSEIVGPNVQVHVKDTGIGIPPADIPHVFERFYRVDKGRSRRLGGSGLGLALASEITEQHGGSIAIESIPDIGTTISVILPLAKEGER